MVTTVLDNQDFLTALAYASRYKQNRMISLASSSQIRAIQEIALNCVENNIPFPNKDKSMVIKGRYLKYIKKAGSKGSVDSKRKLFIQRSGMLEYIIPAALKYLLQKHG